MSLSIDLRLYFDPTFWLLTSKKRSTTNPSMNSQTFFKLTTGYWMFCFVAKVLYFFFLFEIGGIFVVTILKTFRFLEQLLDDSKKRIWNVALSNWNFLFEKHGLTFWNWKSIFFFILVVIFQPFAFCVKKSTEKI